MSRYVPADWLVGSAVDPTREPPEPFDPTPGFPYTWPGCCAVPAGKTGKGRSALMGARSYDAAKAGLRVLYLGSEITEGEFNYRARRLAHHRGEEVDADLVETWTRVRYELLAETLRVAWDHPDGGRPKELSPVADVILPKKGGRRATGSVVEKPTRRGMTFALRFRAYGDRQYETLGSEREGWTRELAEAELEQRLAAVTLGQYVPPRRAIEVEEPDDEPTFREFAWRWFDGIEDEIAASTAEVYRWHVRMLVDRLGELRLSEVTFTRVNEFKRAMLREQKALAEARDRGEEIPHRPLSRETVNKVLTRLGQILAAAKRHGYVSDNPAREEGVKLKVRKPQRSYLDSAHQIEALLAAAKHLDAEATRYRHVGRHAMIAVMVFAGLRLGEMLSLRWRDVDLAGGWLRVKEDGDAKTEAGTRRIKIRPARRDVLLERKAPVGGGPNDLVFATDHGKQHSQSNVRQRILVKAVELADEKLDTPLPRITPHSLRRTYASVLYGIGEPPPVVMQEMGHTDPKLALQIYAQALRRDEGEIERLRALVDGLGTGPVLVPETPRIAPNPIPAS